MAPAAALVAESPGAAAPAGAGAQQGAGESQEQQRVVGPDIYGSKEKYQLLRSLQAALFGGVYEAKGCSSRQRYAVKVLHKSELQKTPPSLDFCEVPLSELRFEEEMKGHPHIVEVHEAFEDEYCHYIVFELAARGDLLEALKLKPDGFRERECRFLIREAVLGLQKLHERKLAMQDVSLENLLIFDYDGKIRIKICDPGQAVLFSENEAGEEQTVPYKGLVGKSFRPPELSEKKPYLATKVDSWCLGWSTFYLLCALPLFLSADHQQRDPDYWTYFRRGEFEGLFRRKNGIDQKVSPECLDFILSLMKINPAERLSVRDCLEHPWLRAVEGEGPQAPPEMKASSLDEDMRSSSKERGSSSSSATTSIGTIPAELSVAEFEVVERKTAKYPRYRNQSLKLMQLGGGGSAAVYSATNVSVVGPLAAANRTRSPMPPRPQMPSPRFQKPFNTAVRLRMRSPSPLPGFKMPFSPMPRLGAFPSSGPGPAVPGHVSPAPPPPAQVHGGVRACMAAAKQTQPQTPQKQPQQTPLSIGKTLLLHQEDGFAGIGPVGGAAGRGLSGSSSSSTSCVPGGGGAGAESRSSGQQQTGQQQPHHAGSLGGSRSGSRAPGAGLAVDAPTWFGAASSEHVPLRGSLNRGRSGNRTAWGGAGPAPGGPAFGSFHPPPPVQLLSKHDKLPADRPIGAGGGPTNLRNKREGSASSSSSAAANPASGAGAGGSFVAESEMNAGKAPNAGAHDASSSSGAPEQRAPTATAATANPNAKDENIDVTQLISQDPRTGATQYHQQPSSLAWLYQPPRVGGPHPHAQARSVSTGPKGARAAASATAAGAMGGNKLDLPLPLHQLSLLQGRRERSASGATGSQTSYSGHQQQQQQAARAAQQHFVPQLQFATPGAGYRSSLSSQNAPGGGLAQQAPASESTSSASAAGGTTATRWPPRGNGTGGGGAPTTAAVSPIVPFKLTSPLLAGTRFSYPYPGPPQPQTSSSSSTAQQVPGAAQREGPAQTPGSAGGRAAPGAGGGATASGHRPSVAPPPAAPPNCEIEVRVALPALYSTTSGGHPHLVQEPELISMIIWSDDKASRIVSAWVEDLAAREQFAALRVVSASQFTVSESELPQQQGGFLLAGGAASASSTSSSSRPAPPGPVVLRRDAGVRREPQFQYQVDIVSDHEARALDEKVVIRGDEFSDRASVPLVAHGHDGGVEEKQEEGPRNPATSSTSKAAQHRRGQSLASAVHAEGAPFSTAHEIQYRSGGRTTTTTSGGKKVLPRNNSFAAAGGGGSLAAAAPSSRASAFARYRSPSPQPFTTMRIQGLRPLSPVRLLPKATAR